MSGMKIIPDKFKVLLSKQQLIFAVSICACMLYAIAFNYIGMDDIGIWNPRILLYIVMCIILIVYCVLCAKENKGEYSKLLRSMVFLVLFGVMLFCTKILLGGVFSFILGILAMVLFLGFEKTPVERSGSE